jgi:hypothetical protein
VRRAHAGAAVAVGVGGGLGTGSSNVGRYAGETVAATPNARGRSGDRATQTPVGGSRFLKDLVPWMESPELGGGPVKPFPQRSRLITGLLGLFLGFFGVHRFYLGYTTIGLLQIAALLTGIGAVWGMIEGVIILSGAHFPDVLGRPLLGRDRSQRSALIRTLWGFVGAAAMIGCCAMLITATFVPPEYDHMSIRSEEGGWRQYSVNMMHMFYGIGGALGSLSLFSIWKASHRAGLPVWRATVRPGLICAMLAILGAALTFERFFAAGEMQLVGMAVAAVAAAAVTVFWILRGPPLPPQPDDAYWHAGWRPVFRIGIVVGVLLFIGNMAAMQKSSYRFALGEAPFRTLPREVERYDYKARETRVVKEDLVLANTLYSHRPLAAVLLGCFVFGAIRESRYRCDAARRAAECPCPPPAPQG